ncbi:hypothetical protein [Streptomyces sp. ISL-11]|uniref:hypothetical protein n=1 Tax=Streptomyces sp. ISL-11 TaxID=2819174 RepID=UPI001BEA48B9|nr:hypothetical protein [Streptomyces sp. ISL-11]MBT2384059.1 hypothetical protein [Streptomyces sp. ISL-11]
MPVVTDLDSVPLTPVYTIVISTAGQATIEGEPVEPLPGQDARTSALADIRVRAALRGHPIRINAKEPDGTVWPLIVDHDGAVTPLSAPHPVPLPAPVRPAPAPVAEPVRPAPTPAPAPTPVRAAAPAQPPVPPQPAPAPQPPAGWQSALPAHHAPRFARIVAAELAGDLAAAGVAAKELEAAVDREYGPLHPHTIGALGTRAWLSLLLQDDWAAATRLHLRTAERRDTARAPLAETRRTLRNAHAAWRRLAATDAAEAEEIRPELLRVTELIEGEPPQE